MGLDALLKLVTGRAIPAAVPDGSDVKLRGGRFGEAQVLSVVRKQHLLADEGSYYVANNAQTGIASSVGTAFSATAGFMTVSNTDSADNTNSRRIFMDYVNLTTTAAGSWASAGVNLQIMVYLSMSERYVSGGTELTIQSPNSSAPGRDTVARLRMGAITTSAALGTDRPICGLRILRPAVSSTVADVIGETKQLNFGGVEAMLNGSITVAAANMISVPLPPIVIGPGHSMVVHFIMNGTTPAAASYAPEVGWWER